MQRNPELQGGLNSSVALGVLAFLIAAVFGGRACAEGPVHIEGGWVEGVQENGAMVFKGLPFAAPPVGELRWQDPQPPLPGLESKRLIVLTHQFAARHVSA